ncbi:MAG: hypothetical protein CK427_08790 [Leptospira sp.]|jgi:hypothetical protein|nr:MAG: hypothetical protein CK427_08790 [Leptospira sp.]
MKHKILITIHISLLGFFNCMATSKIETNINTILNKSGITEKSIFISISKGLIQKNINQYSKEFIEIIHSSEFSKESSIGNVEAFYAISASSGSSIKNQTFTVLIGKNQTHKIKYLDEEYIIFNNKLYDFSKTSFEKSKIIIK